ncbi:MULTISPECIES: heavy metal translocating P-type ATPase [unclassified Rhizobium]|uniref:heavy metal translocating P-type ATPase n=1 Tax=unclassified Rhizobium TaxID=2613769 RepID=UPI001ADB33E4|nr:MULTISPECIES: heavy metal translocating P-type ATPase [unclassified Rhizobium]MBO9099799.1 cadmium-translocating P-type ATPase [Rhizobium sp. L58/93]MBO9131658.1 cadmium-translocating P-type ATPase [Rhizobium sp. B209b/85]MBO9169788.1 cadmium-translocating P-type ATPase [Rhizobium sp. L245/93]MBO9185746.1 cadmium-translocating P-type ATPase [Rhizobium sp. E27B/91]QXZ82509.1 cadmium-translocating P-type ATPase [Rhizobium sp. K1/93]
MTAERTDRLKTTLLLVAMFTLALGLLLYVLDQPDAARLAWQVGVVPVLAALIFEIARSVWRGEVGLDIVAALSMTAALLFGETLAAAVVAVMYSGGTFLESFAEGRARREMSALLARVPRTATRYAKGGLEDVALEIIEPGDLLLIHQGGIVPADGDIESPQAILDKSALTGESMPARLDKGQEAMSGSTNAGEAFDLRVRHRAADSTYAGIVRLVEAAQASKAPMARLADRYSLWFLLVTIAMSAAAWWFTGDPIRAVAVLVVATPCPLILAVPVALVAGLSRAAHFGVLIKGAKPLEALARISTLILDKTGTLTDGRPQIVSIEAHNGMSDGEILYFAAALEQASKHPMAQAIVAAARRQGVVLPLPENVIERPGEGVIGVISGRQVSVGGIAFVSKQVGVLSAASPIMDVGTVVVALSVDNRIAGYITMADALRTGTVELVANLRLLGIKRILLATGDRRAVAETVTRGLALDAVRSDLTPDQKVLLVLTERKNGSVMMVGDGVNDAPALAAADIGVAMGARGAAASAEAADIVLLVDHLDRLLPGIEIAKSSRRIAMESVIAGIAMSIIGMIAAALGYLTPVQGAVLQELIDVAVILNSLRALRITPRIAPVTAED